jgi:hypothetical protein
VALYDKNDNPSPLESLPDLLARVETLQGEYRMDTVFLRGQEDFDWGLLPTIGREQNYAEKVICEYNREREDYLLNRFRRYTWEFLKQDLNDRQLLLLARHHGVPVRLLDWTSNPLVALYFACSDTVGEHQGLLSRRLKIGGAVWAFVRCQHKHEDFYDFFSDPRGPLDLPGVKMIFGPYVSPRIRAQACVFTVQDNPTKDLGAYDPSCYPKRACVDIERIVRWPIPGDLKPRFLRELERVGINERTMFPDLDGIARSIIRTEVLRTGVDRKPSAI